ncbi:MAG: HlyD family secretion protein [Bacteroidales bacterium]|nr:HlyD family secretion protein [Bacteroidales bacterium]
MPGKKDHIIIKSDEVEDILGRVPGWVTRNGAIIFLVIISILLLGSWIFKVPDVKKASITITSIQPPAQIEARSFGKIEKLLVFDNENVEEGTILAEIENSADLQDVQNLKLHIGRIDLYNVDYQSIEFPLNGDAEFGTIQDEFAVFNKNRRDYLDFIELNYHRRKIELLREELQLYRDHSSRLIQRTAILNEEYELAAKQYNRDSVLYAQGVVSESDFENSKSVMLQKQGDWQQVASLKSENDILIAGIRKEILEMELRQQEERTLKLTKVEESLNKLKAAIAQWEKQFLIIAPVSGQVTFNDIWSENQNVKVGDKVMTVIPGDAGHLLGKIMLPLRGAGEVQTGQQVNIMLDNFPYLKYGMIRGEVTNVSKVPQNDFYSVEVQLPDGLKTYYGIEIGFHQQMHGTAEIITDNMRLLQRIFNPVRSAVSRQKKI